MSVYRTIGPLFLYWGSSVKFREDDVSADASVKGTFLTLATQMLASSDGHDCSVDDLLYSAACRMFEFHNAIDLFRVNG